MANYKITDPTTGRTITVSGEEPPTPEDVESLFAQAAPPPQAAVVPPAPQMPGPTPMPSALSVANEAIAGAARPLAEMVDILQSPYQVFRMSVLGKEPQSVRSVVGGERGQYAGPGLISDIAASAGEMATMALSTTAAARGVGAMLLDDAMRYGESAARGILRAFGESTPAQDLLASTASAAGTETLGSLGEAIGGTAGRQLGAGVGGVAFPLGVSPLLNRMTSSVDSLIMKNAPDAKAIRGASRLLYQQIEDLGIVFGEKATAKLVKQLEEVATKEDLSGLRRDNPVSGQYRIVRDMLSQEGGFTGTQYSMLDKASSTFRDIAKTKKGEDAGRIAGQLADEIDGFLINVTPNDLAYYRGQQGTPGTGLAPTGLTPVMQSGAPATELESVGKTLLNARGLWRRANSARLIEGAVEEARIASLGIGRSSADFDTAIASNMRKMLLENPSSFSAREKTLIEDALKGGRLRNTVEVLSQFGIKSNDYVMASLLGIGSGMVARDNISDAAAFGAAAVAGTKAFSMLTQSIVSKMFKSDIKLMQASIAAGANARAQVKAYLEGTPSAQRDPKKLAALLVTSGADLSDIAAMPAKYSPFLSDAVVFASALRTALEEEKAKIEQQPQQ